MNRTAIFIIGAIAILSFAAVVAGQETKAVQADSIKRAMKNQKMATENLAELEKIKAIHMAALQKELQEILQRTQALPDSLREEALVNEIQNMQTLRKFKEAQYQKRLMDSTAARSKENPKLRQGQSQELPEKTRPQDVKNPPAQKK